MQKHTLPGFFSEFISLRLGDMPSSFVSFENKHTIISVVLFKDGHILINDLFMEGKSVTVSDHEWSTQVNKAGYTTTPVACGWAGAVSRATRAFGQKQ